MGSAHLLPVVTGASFTHVMAVGTDNEPKLVVKGDVGGTSPIVTYSGTSVTAQLSDAGGYLRFTGSNPTFTVPPNSSVPFPVPTRIDGIGVATAMTLIQGSGVTLDKARTLVTVGAKSGWSLVKVDTDEWDLHGDFV